MEQVVKRLGARIRQLRKAQKLTQSQLAEKTDLSDNYIGNIERGSRSASVEVLERIAQALQISLKELFDFPAPASYQEQLLSQLNGLLKNKSTEDIELILKMVKKISL